MTRWREQSCLARVSIDYIAGQSVVLPGHVEQTVASFGHGFFLGPLPKLRRLFAVMRDAFQFSATRAGRCNIGWHKAVRPMIAPTEHKRGGVEALGAPLCTWLFRSCASIARRGLLRKTAIGPKPLRKPRPDRLSRGGCNSRRVARQLSADLLPMVNRRGRAG